jgi:hypothetical protein
VSEVWKEAHMKILKFCAGLLVAVIATGAATVVGLLLMGEIAELVHNLIKS